MWGPYQPFRVYCRLGTKGSVLLERAIAEHLDYAFENTLEEIPSALLEEATAAGIEVRVWYVGLASVELHIERVRGRVSPGRTRYSREENPRALRPQHPQPDSDFAGAPEWRVYDKQLRAGDPLGGEFAAPVTLLHNREIVSLCGMESAPDRGEAESCSLRSDELRIHLDAPSFMIQRFSAPCMRAM